MRPGKNCLGQTWGSRKSQVSMAAVDSGLSRSFGQVRGVFVKMDGFAPIKGLLFGVTVLFCQQSAGLGSAC